MQKNNILETGKLLSYRFIAVEEWNYKKYAFLG